MSSHNYSDQCPVCQNQMDLCSETRPIDRINGSCLNCGFSVETVLTRLTVMEINEQRDQYNDDQELSENEELKPLTQADLVKYDDTFKQLEYCME